MHAQEKTNRRLGMLTILSAIFMPITLLAGIWGMNFEGMRRRGYSAELISALRRAYKVVYRQGLTTSEAMAIEGHRAAQGLPSRINSRPLATMLPQSGEGGGRPSPRNPSVPMAKMA